MFLLRGFQIWFVALFPVSEGGKKDHYYIQTYSITMAPSRPKGAYSLSVQVQRGQGRIVTWEFNTAS